MAKLPRKRHRHPIRRRTLVDELHHRQRSQTAVRIAVAAVTPTCFSSAAIYSPSSTSSPSRAAAARNCSHHHIRVNHSVARHHLRLSVRYANSNDDSTCRCATLFVKTGSGTSRSPLSPSTTVTVHPAGSDSVTAVAFASGYPLLITAAK